MFYKKAPGGFPPVKEKLVWAKLFFSFFTRNRKRENLFETYSKHEETPAERLVTVAVIIDQTHCCQVPARTWLSFITKGGASQYLWWTFFFCYFQRNIILKIQIEGEVIHSLKMPHNSMILKSEIFLILFEFQCKLNDRMNFNFQRHKKY